MSLVLRGFPGFLPGYEDSLVEMLPVLSFADDMTSFYIPCRIDWTEEGAGLQKLSDDFPELGTLLHDLAPRPVRPPEIVFVEGPRFRSRREVLDVGSPLEPLAMLHGFAVGLATSADVLTLRQQTALVARKIFDECAAELTDSPRRRAATGILEVDDSLDAFERLERVLYSRLEGEPDEFLDAAQILAAAEGLEIDLVVARVKGYAALVGRRDTPRVRKAQPIFGSSSREAGEPAEVSSRER